MSNRLIDPMDETVRPRGRPAARLDSLEGKKIALLDISKPGGSFFLDELDHTLRNRFLVRETFRLSKPTFARPAPQPVIDEILASGCDAVVEALAD